ncbi:MAG: hypothetical protein B7Y37_13675 [Sphingobacteriia bacterium 28-36-52]|nr:MAG: hypothetical protein B7Y37_13675 [Sphingobacteriia bacterium 28-36-52]
MEILASELRIGNKLFGGVVSKIEENSFTVFDGCAYWNSSEMTENWLLDQPIRLTTEILEKCGFEKATDEFGGYLSPLYKGGRIRIDDNTWYNGCFDTEIKHLHQLQNLYFALTNTELTFKL